MPEYIERAYIMNQITSSEMQANLKQMDGAGAYNLVIGIINAAPAADVAPVRHGWWIRKAGKSICNRCGAFAKWEDCGDGFWGMAETNYCPNCGCKMQRDDDGTE